MVLWVFLTFFAILTFAGDFYYKEYMRVYRIVHFIMIYHLIAKLSSKYELRLLYKIAAISFFIYVFHEPWMGYAAQLCIKIIHPHGILAYMAPLFLVVFTITFSYAVYQILQKRVPRLLNIITGSRAK